MSFDEERLERMLMPPVRARALLLRDEVKTFLEKCFAEVPALSSVLLSAAQYWADEASDAVHLEVTFSAHQLPEWPHRCRGYGTNEVLRPEHDVCRGCASEPALKEAPWWDENGMAVRAMQAYCGEYGNQESWPVSSYVPCLVARRGPGAITWEVIAPVQRAWLDVPQAAPPDRAGTDCVPDVPEPIIDVASSPWLEAVYQAPHEDGPRLVLADVLQQRQDAQGDFIAYCLADAKDGARTELATKANALLEAHRELWLGRLQATVAAGDADFSRGLLTGANVYFGEDADEHLDYPEWATVERLHFSHQSEQRYPARLTGLREVTNVTDARALVTGAPIEQLEALQVEVRALGELLELVTRLEFELPALRRLAVTFYRQEWMAAAEAEPLLAVAPIVSHWSQQLTELTLLGTTYFSGPELVDPQTEDAQVARAMIRRAMTVPLPRQARLRVGFLSSARLPTGWLATIAPVDAADSGTLRLELAGLGPTSAPALRTAMLIDLPARFTHIDLVAGRCWSPRERDVSEVAAATGRVVRVVK